MNAKILITLATVILIFVVQPRHLLGQTQNYGIITCTISAVPPIVRAEGIAELVGDIVLTCTTLPRTARIDALVINNNVASGQSSDNEGWVQIQRRKLDDEGNPTGTWLTIARFNGKKQSVKLKVPKEQPYGVFEFRVRWKHNQWGPIIKREFPRKQ